MGNSVGKYGKLEMRPVVAFDRESALDLTVLRGSIFIHTRLVLFIFIPFPPPLVQLPAPLSTFIWIVPTGNDLLSGYCIDYVARACLS